MIDQLTVMSAIGKVLDRAGITVSNDRLNVPKSSCVVIQLPELSFLELDYGWAHANQSSWPLDLCVTYDKNGRHVAKSVELTERVLEALQDEPDLGGAEGVIDAVPTVSASPFYSASNIDGSPSHYVRTVTLKINHDGA